MSLIRSIRKTAQNQSPVGRLSSILCSIIFLSSPTLRSETHPKKIKVIAITEIVAHASLEEAKAGILAQLKTEGFEMGKNLKVLEENAHGRPT